MIFTANVLIVLDAPDEETAAQELMDVTDLVSCEMEDEGRQVEFVAYKMLSIEEGNAAYPE